MKKLNTTEAKQYLEFLDKTMCDLIINRQIYLDFYNALINQKAITNDFIKWALRNYYLVLIINLCRITDTEKHIDDKTLKGFLELCKIPENWNALKRTRLDKKIYAQNLETGEQMELDVSHEIQQIFDSIKVDDDINTISNIHEQLKLYRNKKIAHLTTTEVNIENLNFNELHKMVDNIEDIINKYYHMLGIAIVNDALKTPYFYGNFQLTLK